MSMPKREIFPTQRKYSTFSALSTTSPSLLKRATDILNCMGNGFNSATEIATYCNYSISTVHRLLQNLAELDWVIQDNTNHRYYLGPQVTKLSSNIMASHRYIVLHALKEMSRLANMTDETVMLGALDQLHYIKLFDIPSPQNLRIIEASDKLKGQYLGATAKVLLSQLDDKELKVLFKHIKTEPTTPASVTDTAVMMEQIQEIRRKGYGISYGERIKGAICISAPVTNYFCPLALYMVGPDDRLKPQVKKMIAEVVNSAQQVSEEIAGVFNG